MSVDEQAPQITVDEHAPNREQQDAPESFPVSVCPSCGNSGIGRHKAHGAGTRIEHPGRAFPCSTTTVLEIPTG